MYMYNVIIFIIVLVVYTHVIFHNKKSNDMEIYNISDYMDYRFNDICDQRQPVLFKVDNISSDELSISNILHTHGSFSANIRNNDISDDDFLYKEAPIRDIIESTRKNDHILCENNINYMKESGLYSYFFDIDNHIRPPLTCHTSYDMMFGSKGATTPLKYELSYRTFFLCKSGKIRLKLTPPINKSDLATVYDYEHFEFRSDVNPWLNKTGCSYLDVTMIPGDCIYIPSHWWYSICYDETDTIIYKLSYKTCMNIATISPYIMLHYLQLLNIRYKVTQTIDDIRDDTI